MSSANIFISICLAIDERVKRQREDASAVRPIATFAVLTVFVGGARLGNGKGVVNACHS